jgi:hypothetical protein
MSRHSARIALVVLVVAGVSFFLLPSRRQPGPVDADGTPLVDTSQVRPAAVLSDGYVSSTSCKECHPREFKSWHASYHRTMTQVVNSETAPSVLHDTTVTVEGQRHRFHFRDGRFWMEMDNPQPGDDVTGTTTIEHEIVMMTGSHHMHVFWYPSGQGRTLAAAPLTFLLDEQQWIPRASAFLKPTVRPQDSETGRWNVVCCRCHTTHPRPRPLMGPNTRINTWDTTVAEFGIACERCHGPGGAHVEAMKGGSRRASDMLVNPSKLNSRRASEVCGQCHSLMMPRPGHEERLAFMMTGDPYRPGDELANASSFQLLTCDGYFDDPVVKDVVRDRLDGDESQLPMYFWSDGMIRVSGSEYTGLIRSPCYQRGELSCLSCHTMHDTAGYNSTNDWANDQLLAGMTTNTACLQCHAEMDDDLESHTHHSIDSSGSLCMNCHMPYTTYGLLKAIRSHQISSPNVSASLRTGRMAACNQCHLDRSLKWTSQYLADWYGHNQPVMNYEHESIAVSVRHALKGDAGQRALVAWSFGWKPAHDQSGTEWMAPYLLTLMTDDYDAVRLIAYRSIRRLPECRDLQFDPLAPGDQRTRITAKALNRWKEKSARTHRPELLLGPNGELLDDTFQQLFDERDHRAVILNE